MPTTPGSTRLPGDDLGSSRPHPGDGPMDTTPLTSSAASGPAASGRAPKTARIPAPWASSNTSVDLTEARRRNDQAYVPRRIGELEPSKCLHPTAAI